MLTEKQFAFVINQPKFYAVKPALSAENIARERFFFGKIDG